MFKSLKLKKWTSLFVTLMMFLSFLTPIKVSAVDSPEIVDLQIIATSDLHGRFMPYDYAINAPDMKGSLAQIATAVKKFRAENPNTIVVDNGDTIQDNSSSLFLNDPIHPMILGLNEIGCDTWTLGNHEFNFGMTTLGKVMNQFKGTVLCGNVKKSGTPIAAPYTVIEKGGVKVAIIGMVTPNITKWDVTNLSGYDVTNPIDETKAAIAAAKAEGADVFIAVEHMSEDPEYDKEGSGAKQVIDACPEISVFVAGHAHSQIKGEFYNNTLIVEPYKFGYALSKINLKITKDSSGYKVVKPTEDITSDLVFMSDYDVDTDLAAKFKPFHDIAIADANTVIGKLEGGDLVPPDEVKGIPTAQIQDTSMIDLINEVQMYYGKADVSAAAAFRSDANIKEGEIKKSDTSLIYKYDNTLRVYEITGAQLKEYMEWSAAYYNTFKEGDLTVSFNPNIRGYNYDMFSGVKYEVDITKEAGNRIVNLRHMDDTPVTDTEKIKLAINNYRADTTLFNSENGLFKGQPIVKTYDSFESLGDAGRIRDLIREYIINEKGGVIHPDLDNNWKVIGNNWDEKQRSLAVKLINEGKIEIPTSEDGRTPNAAAVTWDMVKAAAERIDILTFNDFHGIVDFAGKDTGIVKFAGAVKAYKAANPNTIVVSAGDNFQGSAMSNLTYGAPINEMMKAIGVTASAVGNHEFDWGTEKIPEWATEGGYDYLASNIYDKTTGKPVKWAEPYKVVETAGLKIGLIGLATPETAYKTKAENVKNIEFKDPAESAKYWAGKLKDGSLPEGKVDVVVALTHLGSYQNYDTGEITGEITDLCNTKNIGVDAFITGHTHQTVCGSVNGIPVIQAYKNGRTLGVISLYLDADGKLMSIDTKIDNLYKRQDTLVDDPEVKAIYDKYAEKLLPILGEIIATTDKDLTHDRYKEGTSVLGAWVCDVMRKEAGTQIAITNGGGLRCPIEKGDITVGKMYEVMPFDNTLVTMTLTGDQLKRAIENGIGNEDIGWVQVSGLKVYYDLTREFGDRITSMRLLDGTKVLMDKTYTVVTNDFMATGGDNYNFEGAADVLDTMVPIRDALIAELREINDLSYEYDAPLIAGEDPNPNDSGVTEIPQTGSMVDMSVLLTIGASLSAAGYVLCRRKKENEDDAA